MDKVSSQTRSRGQVPALGHRRAPRLPRLPRPLPSTRTAVLTWFGDSLIPAEGHGDVGRRREGPAPVASHTGLWADPVALPGRCGTRRSEREGEFHAAQAGRGLRAGGRQGRGPAARHPRAALGSGPHLRGPMEGAWTLDPAAPRPPGPSRALFLDPTTSRSSFREKKKSQRFFEAAASFTHLHTTRL